MASGANAMTKEHKLRLRHYTPALMENMDPDPVISKLYSKEVLTLADKLEIKGNSRTPKEDKVQMLMEKLVKKPDNAFGIFLEVLEEVEQGHIAKTILKEVDVTDSPAAALKALPQKADKMSTAHKEQLQKAADELKENMNPDPVLMTLWSREVITMAEKNIIMANGRATRMEKAECIMDDLPGKSDSAFQVLIDALNDSEQYCLAQLIISKGVPESALPNLPDVPTDEDLLSQEAIMVAAD